MQGRNLEPSLGQGRAWPPRSTSLPWSQQNVYDKLLLSEINQTHEVFSDYCNYLHADFVELINQYNAAPSNGAAGQFICPTTTASKFSVILIT